jgi:D-3-phosphoglycerate dehydrogenase / 2-oxoglutarate reductase
MTRVAVITPYFHFFPKLKAEFESLYPGAKFRTDRSPLSEDALIAYLKGYEAAVIGLDRFTERVCASLPDLKVVSLCSAGADHVDPAILNKHAIKMWWAAGVNKISVAELAVCYMVFAIRRVHFFASVLRRGEWKGPVGFGADLRGRTVGIHGCGHIGKEVVKLLKPYGVKVLACDRIDFSEFYKQWDVEPVEAAELWARSDVLTIHLSRNKSTIGLYDAAVLDRLKRGVILVNCARGAIVDEHALKVRLESGHVAAAAFDVFAAEPANGNPLLDVPNFFGSPHIGATTNESWEAMLRSGMLGIAKAYRAEPGQYPFD